MLPNLDVDNHNGVCMHQITPLVDTLYPHKVPRRTTRYAPDGKHVTSSQHVWLHHGTTYNNYRFLNVKPKTRTFPGTDFGSDHGLVLMTIKPKLATNRKNTDLQLYLFDLDKLQHPNISTEWVEEWNALGERSTKWHDRGIIPNAHLASGTDEPWGQDYKRFSSMSRCSTHNLCSEMT